MATPNDASVVTCTNNSDYAVICSFFEQFGDKSGLLFPSFHDLQQMLENVEEVSYPLIELHVKLMRKLKKSVNFDRWEKAAAKYAHTYSDQDGWEIERFGYKKINLAVKLRLLKNLLEAQFDGNIKFKNEINKVTSDELRLQPLGKDIQGRRYWHLLDDDCNLRVYREDLDEESWDLVSSDKESMVKLIEQLSARKEITEEEGTSPATSEESGANGQEEYNKVESEENVQQSTDGPSETKRPKVDEPSKEEPAAKLSTQEGVVGEAIESPVLLVKGEGNGADCDTGNPGKDKSEETCESKNEQDETADTSAIDCGSERLKSCVDSSESVLTVQPNSEPSESVPGSASQLETTNPIRDNCKETPPSQLNSETSVESNSVEPPVPDDSSEARTVVNPPEKSTDPSTPVTESTAEDLPADESDSSKESTVAVEEPTRLSTEEDTAKPISIDAPSTEVDGSSEHQECAVVSDINVMSSVSKDDVDRSAVTVVSEQIERTQSIAETPEKPEVSVDLSVAHDPDLPKTGFHSEEKLDPLPPESPTVEKPVDSTPDDPVSQDQSHSISDSNAVSAESASSPPPVDNAPKESEAVKEIDEPVSLPVNEVIPSAASVQEKSPEIEESHSEQIAEPEAKNEHVESSQVVGNVDFEKSEESERPTSDESPVQPDIAEEKSIPVVGDSLEKTNEPEIGCAPDTITDVPKENLTPETEIVPGDSTSAIQSDSAPSKDANEATTTAATESPEINLMVPSNSSESSDPSSTLHETTERPERPLVLNDVSINEPSTKVEGNLISGSPVVESATPVEGRNVLDEDRTLIHPAATDEEPVPDSHTDPSSELAIPSCGTSPTLVVDAESTNVASEEENSALQLSNEVETSADSTKERPSEKLVENAVTSAGPAVDEASDSVTAKLSNVPHEVASIPENTREMELAPTEPEGLGLPKDGIPTVGEKELASEECELAQCSIPTSLPKEPEEVKIDAPIDENQRESDVPAVSKVVEEKEDPAIPEVQLKDESTKLEPEVSNKKVVADRLEGNDEIPATLAVPKEESSLVPKELESDSIPEVAQKSEEKKIESEGIIVDEKIPASAAKEELITPKDDGEVAPDSVPEVSQKNEPTLEEPEGANQPEAHEEIPRVASKEGTISSPINHELASHSIPSIPEVLVKNEVAVPPEGNEILTIPTKQELTAPHFPDEPVADPIPKVSEKSEQAPATEATVEIPSVPVALKTEESTVKESTQVIIDAVPENLDIKTPENNCVEDRTESPKSPTLVIKEEVSHLPTSPVPVQNDQEVRRMSEAVAPNPSEDVLPSKIVAEAPSTDDVKEKPDVEKSSTFNQLSFDFDASAPATIILPPSSRKSADNAAKRGRGRKRGRQAVEETADSGKENDAQPLVLRQSSRIAKLREKEDEERRKQEADRLQRLKEEHERREKRRTARDERMKKMEEKQQRRQQKTTREEVAYRESEEESSSSEEEEEEEEGRKKRGKKRKKNLKKKNDRPWDSTDSSEKSSESEEDGLEDLQVEEENEELVFKSDHEFSPESDLDDEPVQPRKHARTARAGTIPKKRGRSKKVKIEEVEEEEVATEEEEEDEDDEEKEANCHKCGQSDHPEWILLCDRCDAGWHANCVKPPLMVIPEGNWFCPPCDHATLLERLQERLEAYEFLLQEKEAELGRKKEQEMEAKLAREAAEKQALEEMEEEAQEEDDEDEKNSGVGDLGGDGEDAEDEETSEESGDDEDEEDDEDGSQNESDENLNGRRQRKAAKQANYSFKDFDDMIKSALRDDGEEEEEEGGKGKGKGMRAIEKSDEDEDKPRSPPGVRPSGIGNKRISTSDDDSDVMPQVLRKKKARKLNDLSATSNEDDSDEDFKGSSAEGSDSEEDDEEASDSGDSFVVDDDSDDDDVIHVRAKPKARAASPTIRRSTRSARKRNIRMDSSDTSEEESEYEVSRSNKRKRGNESWDSSGASSSDASWGRSKKRRSAPKGRAKPVAPPKPKPKPPPRKAPANRGRGRGGRASKLESDDEDKPFRSNVSVKKIKEARPVAQEDEDSDHAQRRTTRGRQISYKELISSGESADEGGSTVKKMGTLFAADRNKSNAGAAIRGGASRRGRGGVTTPVGRGSHSGGDNTPVPVSVISSSRVGAAAVTAALSQDDESRFSGSTDTLEFSAAAAAAAAAASVYTTGDESHTSNDVLPPTIDPDLAALPIILPQEDETGPLIKDELPSSVPISVLSQDLQVSRLIQQRPVDVAPPSTLPPDLQINRLINSQSISSSSNSPARQSPGILPQQRLVRDVLDSQTPPPAVQLSPAIAAQPVVAPSGDLPLYSHGGVIKQTRHSLPPTPPLYSGPHVVKATDLIASSTPPSVIRPYPTTATSSPLSPSVSSGSTPGNPLSIQGLLGTGHSSPGPAPSAPPPPHPGPHIRPYGNTSHMIGHGPFLNHTPYGSPYSAVPPSRTSYMGTPVTPTPRPAYSPMYPTSHMPPHGLPLHSPYAQHHGPPLRPTSSYQHAGFPQAFAAAAAAAANAEEERRIYRVAQASREAGADNYDPATGAGLLLKSGVEDPSTPLPATAVPPESEFGGLVSYFSSQQEDFEES